MTGNQILQGPRTPYFPLNANVSTTDATPTQIFSVVIPYSTTVMITVDVAGRRTGGSAGSPEDGAAYRIHGAFKCPFSGAAALIGQTATFTAESQAGWNAAFSASGVNAVFLVTGATKNNVNWTATYQSGVRAV